MSKKCVTEEKLSAYFNIEGRSGFDVLESTFCEEEAYFDGRWGI